MTAMDATTPDWLTKRGGELRRGVGREAWLVLIDGAVQYRLDVVPARGTFACVVTKSVSGKRIDRGGVADSIDAALAVGLNDLRAALGW